MHDSIDKVYSKKSFSYTSKLSKELKDKENELNNAQALFKIYFSNKNNAGVQINPNEKKHFSVDRK